MPKERSHYVSQLQKVRRQKQEAVKNIDAYEVSLHFIGNGASGCPRAVLVSSPQTKGYLFNCGEGTQRLINEYKLKLSGIEHLFVTHNTWLNMGGMAGVALTLQEIGLPEMTLHGPPGIEQLYRISRNTIYLRDMHIKNTMYDTNQFEDNTLSVEYVQLFPHNHRKSKEDIDENIPAAPKQPRLSCPGNVCVAYICKLKDVAGSLRINDCLARGVPKGPLLGLLKKGEDITLSDGRIVLSNDVKDPDVPGPIFIVLECPSEAHLDSLCTSKQFSCFFDESRAEQSLVKIVVHFTPLHIMNLPRYREWMSRFSSSVSHVAMNGAEKFLGSVSVHCMQHKLNLISSQIFPLLCEPGTHRLASRRLDEDGQNKLLEKVTLSSCDLKVWKGETCLAFNLRPAVGFNSSSLLTINTSDFINELEDVPGAMEAIKEFQQTVKCETDGPEKFPHVLFLGTGSAVACKTRNVSSILVRISEESSMLFDCGEGTYGQLIRFYGDKVSEMLSTLRAIFISHHHPDHYLGVISILQACKRLDNSPVYIIAPAIINQWLSFYHEEFESIFDLYSFVNNGRINQKKSTMLAKSYDKLQKEVGLQDIHTTFVNHCQDACGICIGHKDGWKICYSGDTMPSNSLVELGKDCDLLIHEATFKNELEHEAKSKAHSTVAQAISIGEQMNAKFILLTHFSQRYSKVSVVSESSEKVGVAYDFMKVNLVDVHELPKFIPILLRMFPEETGETVTIEGFKKRQKLY